VVDDDGNLELRVTEHQVLPCQTDRRTAWWAVILAMASCVIMAVSAVILAVVMINMMHERSRIRAEADREVNELKHVEVDQSAEIEQLRHTVNDQTTALQCRAELNGELQQALAHGDIASLELLLETADNFDKVLHRRAVTPEQLETAIKDARVALGRAVGETDKYIRSLTGCSD